MFSNLSLPPSHCFAGFGRLRRTLSVGPIEGAKERRGQ